MGLTPALRGEDRDRGDLQSYRESWRSRWTDAARISISGSVPVTSISARPRPCPLAASIRYHTPR